jgi:hypothetical protein
MAGNEPKSHKNPSRRDDDTEVEPPPADRSERAAEVSRDADDLLEDIDEALLLALNLPKDATAEEIEKAALDFSGGFIQKGGE